MSYAQRFSSLVIALVAASGCHDRPPEAPLQPVAWIANEMHPGGGDPRSAARVPTVEIGGERRPVLAPEDPRTVGYASIDSGRSESDPFEIDLDPAFLGHRTVLHARSVETPDPDGLRSALIGARGNGGELPLQLQAFTRAMRDGAGVRPGRVVPEATPTTVVVDVDGAASARPRLVEVLARPAPEGPMTTPVIPVPAGARLRFGIGVKAFARGGPPVVFLVSAIVDDDEEELFREAINPNTRTGTGRWRNREIDLGRFSGRSLRLRFSNPDVASDDDRDRRPVTLPAWGDPVVLAPRPATVPTPPRRPPNVLLVSLDTLRGDHVGAYGYPRPTTPTIDGVVAGRGVVFENAFAPYPHTAPSHATMLTGIDPCVHGAWTSSVSRAPSLPAAALTLAEILRTEGYRTAAFTENAYVTAGVGFARGFGTWVEDRDSHGDRGRVEETFGRASRWLRSSPDEPWLLFVHTYEVHDPYAPPPGYLEEVVGDAPERGVENARARYDAEIRHADDVLARLLAALEERGQADDTLVIVTSDHGEHFGERGWFRHDNTVYEPVLRIPLILRAPGLLPAGVRVPDAVGLFDLVPTVLSLLDLPVPDYVQGLDLSGVVRGEALPPRSLFAESFRQGFRSVRTGDRKYVVDDVRGTREAFDWRWDRGEVRDLGPDVPEAEWEAVERALAGHCQQGIARLRAAGGAEARGASSDEGPDPAVAEKLRSLGYVD